MVSYNLCVAGNDVTAFQKNVAALRRLPPHPTHSRCPCPFPDGGTLQYVHRSTGGGLGFRVRSDCHQDGKYSRVLSTSPSTQD